MRGRGIENMRSMLAKCVRTRTLLRPNGARMMLGQRRREREVYARSCSVGFDRHIGARFDSRGIGDKSAESVHTAIADGRQRQAGWELCSSGRAKREREKIASDRPVRREVAI
jgi:hypothetical protein